MLRSRSSLSGFDSQVFSVPDNSLDFAGFHASASRQRLAEVIVPQLRSAGSWVGDSTIVVAGGPELPVSQMLIAHRDAHGRVQRYSAVMRDISAAVQARRALQLQTATLRAVTEAIPGIVAVVGADRRYRFVNSGFERWIGLPRERVLGHTLADVLSAEDLERSRPWIERVLAGETVHFERIHPGRSSGRNLAMSYTPLVDEAENTSCESL